jgi:hypothetical protein
MMLTTAIIPARSRDRTQRPDRPVPELHHHSHKARPECFGEGRRAQIVVCILESMYCMGNKENTSQRVHAIDDHGVQRLEPFAPTYKLCLWVARKSGFQTSFSALYIAIALSILRGPFNEEC